MLSGLRREPITESAHGFYIAPVRTKLISQPAHVGVDRPSINDRVIAPHIGQQPVSCLDPAFSFHKNRQQPELGRRAFDTTITSRDFVARSIKRQLADRQEVLLFSL